LVVVGLFSGRCFITVVTLASPLEDTLPPRQLWTLLRRMLRRQGIALVSPLADALPPWLLDACLVLSGWMLFHHSYVFSVGNHCVDVFFFSRV